MGFDLPFLKFPQNAKINRNFSPEDFKKEVSKTPVTGAVFVQCANDCLEEASELFVRAPSVVYKCLDSDECFKTP